MSDIPLRGQKETARSDPHAAANPNLVLIGKDRSRPVSLPTVVQLRWLAMVGQVVSIVIVYFRAGFHWPLALALLALGTLAASNLLLLRRYRQKRARWMSTDETVRILGFDVIQAGVVLWFTGGLMNPFIILILAPVIVSASMLNKLSTALLSLIAVVVVTVITMWSPPLPWRSGLLRFPPTYLVAVWASLVIAVVFVALFMQWVADQARRLSDDLLKSQLELERERQFSAVGGIAAAAAHELGTPLSTITLIAKELSHDLQDDEELSADVLALVEETQRCKEILFRLQQTPHRDPGEPYRLVPASTLVELAAKPHARKDQNIVFHIRAGEDLNPEHAFAQALATDTDSPPLTVGAPSVQPNLPRIPELTYGLGNLIQNAQQFARSHVFVAVSWTEQQILVSILDDGPGFDANLLDQLAGGGIIEKVRATHDVREGYSGLGLGVYIAQTLLGRSGGQIQFKNRPLGAGAHIDVCWDRAVLDKL